MYSVVYSMTAMLHWESLLSQVLIFASQTKLVSTFSEYISLGKRVVSMYHPAIQAGGFSDICQSTRDPLFSSSAQAEFYPLPCSHVVLTVTLLPSLKKFQTLRQPLSSR